MGCYLLFQFAKEVYVKMMFAKGFGFGMRITQETRVTSKESLYWLKSSYIHVYMYRELYASCAVRFHRLLYSYLNYLLVVLKFVCLSPFEWLSATDERHVCEFLCTCISTLRGTTAQQPVCEFSWYLNWWNFTNSLVILSNFSIFWLRFHQKIAWPIRLPTTQHNN